MFFNGNSGLTAIAFNGLQAHCPALSLALQGIYGAVFGKIPGNGKIDCLSDLLSPSSCSILCRFSDQCTFRCSGFMGTKSRKNWCFSNIFSREIKGLNMFQGSMVAVATPMQKGNAPETPLDKESLAALVEFHIENKTDAIVAVGTTGESATLNNEEHCEVIRQVVEFVNGRIPVIAGTGANSTTEAIHLTGCAKDAGADACLLVTPYYNKPTQEGLYLHYKAVAEAVNIPQILYNVPGRTACDMLPETIGRLSAVDNIIGVKEATADLARIETIRTLCGDDFMLVSGDDATTKEFLLRGGDGVISVTANVAPRAMHELCEFARIGDREAATKIDDTLTGLHENLFIESNPIPAKWALHKMGLIQAGIRLPLTWMTEGSEDILTRAMKQAHVI